MERSGRTQCGQEVREGVWGRVVTLLEVLGENDVAVLAHGLHPSFLADRRNVRSADLVRPRDVSAGQRQSDARARER
jgi:hypothetical protein